MTLYQKLGNADVMYKNINNDIIPENVTLKSGKRKLIVKINAYETVSSGDLTQNSWFYTELVG